MTSSLAGVRSGLAERDCISRRTSIDVTVQSAIQANGSGICHFG